MFGEEFLPIQPKFVRSIFDLFKDFFERKETRERRNCEICTNFHDPLRPIQVKGKRVPIHILPRAEETIGCLLKDAGQMYEGLFYFANGCNR